MAGPGQNKFGNAIHLIYFCELSNFDLWTNSKTALGGYINSNNE